MYSSSYSQATLGLAARRSMKKPQGKSCGYYMRLVFLFSSLIQSLIILSLVLFLVYGRSPDAAAESRITELEKSFNRVSVDNMNLRLQTKNLTRLLNATQTEKMQTDLKQAKIRELINVSYMYINELRAHYSQSETEKRNCQSELRRIQVTSPPLPYGRIIQVKPDLSCALLRDNFTHTVGVMKIDLANMAKARNVLTLETIALRRDKKFLQDQLDNYRATCKQDFAQSLEGISNVSRSFLSMIDTLARKISTFVLTCRTESVHLSHILNNCTTLSREVETKFQRYLDNVGNQVFEIQSSRAWLQATKTQLAEDYSWCSQNRSAMALEHSQTLKKNQETYDTQMERLLLSIKRLQGDSGLKDTHINILTDQIKDYNASLANCAPKTSISNPTFPRTMGSNPSTYSGPGYRSGGYGSSTTGNSNPGMTGGIGTGVGKTDLEKIWTGMQAYNRVPSGTGTGSTSSAGTSSGGVKVTGPVGGYPNTYSSAGTSSGGVKMTGPVGGYPNTYSSAGTSSGGVKMTGPVGGYPNTYSSAGTSSGGVKMTGPVGGYPNTYSSANINQHLRELQQQLTPNSGKEVSG
ncbi:hypothetical protein DPEC_G00056720 [Dallia pectoralis]|uniref:Uncharacterized protein n=1 Tax=Dallia pectoralis TaxID=75939 RepID=A0ACC2H6M5_DALPE|nr:hypothetical protein DPEC_G00056720 [Dallia pectoralis]